MAKEVNQQVYDAVLKAACEQSFEMFARYLFKARWKRKFAIRPHHITLIKALESAALGDITRLIINICPRSGKTELCKLFLAFLIARNPQARSIYLSYSDDLALGGSADVREYVRMPEFQKFWGRQIRSDSDSKRKWTTTEGAEIYATSTGGALTGFGAGQSPEDEDDVSFVAEYGGCILIDDPIKPKDAESETIRAKTNASYNGTIRSRINSNKTPIIIIAQRLHEDDLCGFLMNGGSGEPWTVISIPVIYQDESGEEQSIWPAKFPIEALRQLEAADPYTFASQYMQNPVPLGGGIFKNDYWRYWRELPEIEYLRIYADTAQKTGQHNDYTVFQVWGKRRNCNEIYLIDEFRDKIEAPELESTAKAIWAKWNQSDIARCRGMKVEDKVSGTGLIQQLRKSKIPVEPISRSSGKLKGDKEARARDAAPFMAAGCVYVPADALWIDEYKSEFATFPKGRHDDQIDPTCDAIIDMLTGSDNLLLPSDYLKSGHAFSIANIRV